jgi:hypothetical protein
MKLMAIAWFKVAQVVYLISKPIYSWVMLAQPYAR